MRFWSSAAVLLIVLFSGAGSGLRAGQFAAAQSSTPQFNTPPINTPSRASGDVDAAATVKTYCSGCHNGVMRSPSGMLLDRFDGAALGADPDAWSRAYRQVQAGAMPPAGARRPDRATAGRLLGSIETALGVTTPRPAAASQAIATRLASMLWDGEPDAALRAEAQRNRLADPVVLDQQVTRMLADDRAEAFVSRFFVPWLGLDQLDQANPPPTRVTGFDVTLRDAMATETRLFIRDQLRENVDPVGLWSARYTFVNEALARHYGISGITGPQLRRVELTASERYGLLGQASILTITSPHGDAPAYTSPASRSLWIRSHFFGVPPPRPFPGAQPVSADRPITPQTRVLPSQPCLQCHQNFFPLAYALENFDTIGRWRTEDQAGPVDSTGVFVDGTPMRGVVGLRDTLLQFPDAFRTTIAERLLLYAEGAPVRDARVTTETLLRARQALRAAQTPRWSSIIGAIVRQQP